MTAVRKQKLTKKKKVLVFGIFDGVHPGHTNFFKQAKEHGDVLVVVVGQDEAVQQFKNKLPNHSMKERLRMVEEVPEVDKVIPGDSEQGSYHVIEHERPDIICLGYDQTGMETSLEKWMRERGRHIPIVMLQAYKSEKFHTRILDK